MSPVMSAIEGQVFASVKAALALASRRSLMNLRSRKLAWRAFDGEDEAVRRGRGPVAEALRTLQPVMGGVDLDRGEMRRGVGKLLGLLQALGIEHPAPGRINPTADADAYAPCL